MKKILLLFFLFAIYVPSKAQIFSQNFSSSQSVNNYVNVAPSSNQFNSISLTATNLTTSIHEESLRFNRTGSANIYAYRNFEFSENPNFVQFKFDFEATNNVVGTQTPVFHLFIGSDFSTASSGSSSKYASRIGIMAQPTAGQFRISTVDNIGGAPQSGVFSGRQTITYIVNNSGSDQTYLAPDGTIESIPNAKMDVWIGISRGINDFSLKNTDITGAISGFKLQATSNSGNGVYDFDNFEFTDLMDDGEPSLNLPNTPTEYLSLNHPFIWASYSERQKIVDNIHQFTWASSLFNQLKARVDARKNTHTTNPEAILTAIPPIPGLLSDRIVHTDIVGSMTESAILYYLTNDITYAQYAADILNFYMKYLVVQPVMKYDEGGPGIIFNDGWLESRALFPRIALAYDFLYNYVNNSSNQVFDLETNTLIQFNDLVAQQTVTNLADIVFMSNRAKFSNHSVLAGNGVLYNLLMISDETKRTEYFNRFYSGNNETHAPFTWILDNFSENAVWPETFMYSKGSHELVIQSLNVIDRYNPSLNVIDNNLSILDGFIGYENWFYPSGEIMRFGDTGTDTEINDGFRWIRRIASRKNMTYYDQFARQKLKYYYNKTNGYTPVIQTDRLEFNSPLQLLWGENVDLNEEEVAPKIESTYHLKHAGLIIQRNLNTPNVKNDGMMYYSGGGAYVHTHSTGIDLELYGKGQVVGTESGSGTYGSDEHENYRVRHAAHNTVVANGSGKRGGTNWLTKVANVNLVASEPKSIETPISTDFTFSTQYLDDSFNSCLQQRTNSIIRTGPNSGYYFDILRSIGKSENNFHDYIYHNIGDAVSLKFVDESNIPLTASTKYSNDLSGSVTGWTFFENVSSSSLIDVAVNAKFTLNSNQYMNVLVPSGVNREYATALAPNTIGALNGYHNKKTPVITMRKYGEAWDEPFVAIYEPYNSLSTVMSVNQISNGTKIIGAKVVSQINDKIITDYIISHDDNLSTYTNSAMSFSFTGRFGILRITEDNLTTNTTMYIGEGETMTYGSKFLVADSDKKGFYDQLELLPVELVNYTAKATALGNLLNWETGSERNNKHFIISRSTDGKTFDQIGVINVNKDKKYEFLDSKPLLGTVYYKLQQVDMDGTENDLGIKSLSHNLIDSKKVSFYPNPSNGILNLNFKENLNESITVLIYDLGGNVLQESILPLNNFSSHYSLLLGENVTSGIYIIKISSSGISFMDKLIVKE